MATSHYLKQCWPNSLTHICSTRGLSISWFRPVFCMHLSIGDGGIMFSCCLSIRLTSWPFAGDRLTDDPSICMCVWEVSMHYLEICWKKGLKCWHANVSWPPSELSRFWFCFLISVILVPSLLGEMGQIWSFQALSVSLKTRYVSCC